MSQKKVDQYKKEKANRKQILKREKIKHNVTMVCSTVVCVAVVGWLGYSAYGYFHQQNKDTKTPTQTEVDLTALSEYMSNLYADDADNTAEE